MLYMSPVQSKSCDWMRIKQRQTQTWRTEREREERRLCGSYSSWWWCCKRRSIIQFKKKKKASNTISARSTFFLRYQCDDDDDKESEEEEWDLWELEERRLGPSLGEWFGVRELDRLRSATTASKLDTMIRVRVGSEWKSERKSLKRRDKKWNEMNL